jgi:hypothetical protein
MDAVRHPELFSAFPGKTVLSTPRDPELNSG